MAEDTIDDVGAEVLAATSDAGRAEAEGTTKTCSQASIEAAVERTMKDLAAEAMREPRERG
jgi:hypothetical protein